MKEKEAFEEIVKNKGTTELGALIEIARQLKRIGDILNDKFKDQIY